MSAVDLFSAIAMGLGATVSIDLWALFLRRAFGVRGLNFCMLGRWVLHMPNGTIKHDNIATAAAKAHECKVGWTTHYLIGAAFGVTFVFIAPANWMTDPTLVPALAFGMVTVLVPFFTLQPAFGLGIASSRTAHPNQARLKSLVTHGVFGVGLWLSGLTLSGLR
ncbi:MAG: DUF2938 domain-containing protein [Gemmatimonadota bacterium]